jgi:plastocyanin
VIAGRWARVVGLVAAAVALAACGRDAGRAAPPVATDRVDLVKSYQFAPAAITVPTGATVTWTNADVFTHSVRLVDDGGAVLVMKPGDSARFTFTSPGLHRYDCSFHPHDMRGTVLVTPAP